jgi:hypothetical protein
MAFTIPRSFHPVVMAKKMKVDISKVNDSFENITINSLSKQAIYC